MSVAESIHDKEKYRCASNKTLQRNGAFLTHRLMPILEAEAHKSHQYSLLPGANNNCVRVSVCVCVIAFCFAVYPCHEARNL